MLTSATLIGKDSVRSGAIVSDLNIRVVEYKFLPNNKAVRTETTFGDGVYKAPVSKNLSYSMEYTENYVGMDILFTPESYEQEPFYVFFNENLLIENGTDTLTDLVTKVEKLEKIANNLSNTTWFFKDSTLWVDTKEIIDSIKTDTTYKLIIVGGRPVGKEPIITYDTIWKKVIDTIGTKTYTSIELAFNRDEKSLVNTGYYSYEHAEYDIDSVEMVSESKYKDYHWGVHSITTDKRFGIRTFSTDENEDFAISLFMTAIKDADGNIIGHTMKVGGDKEYKLKK